MVRHSMMTKNSANSIFVALVAFTLLTLIALNVVSAGLNTTESRSDGKLKLGNFNLSTNLANVNISKNLSRINITSLSQGMINGNK
jgi:hypothetical protein